MIACPICSKSFQYLIRTSHLKTHNINSVEEFIKLYPNSSLKSPNFDEYRIKMSKTKKNQFENNPELRKKISDCTKKGMIPAAIQKIKDKVISKETRDKMSKSSKIRMSTPGVKEKIYTKERNKKVSESKLEYWKTADKTHVTNLWKQVKEKHGENWAKNIYSRLSLKGKKYTKIELKIYKMLEDEGFEFEKQYSLEHKIYDAYVPSLNLLIECDGIFWHKQTLDECKFDIQKNMFHNDRLKEEIAKNNNFKLIRIREDNIPESLTNLFKL